MFKRLVYWLKHKHPCNKCCLFCKFYKKCKEDKGIDDNVCVCCGEIIPEGLQLCPNCEKESERVDNEKP